MTNDLATWAWQHREGLVDGFSKRDGVKLLVYYESYEDVRDAIARETRLKKWKRRWKLELIESMNPEWRDLYEDLNN
jgi:putative endonuclease